MNRNMASQDLIAGQNVIRVNLIAIRMDPDNSWLVLQSPMGDIFNRENFRHLNHICVNIDHSDGLWDLVFKAIQSLLCRLLCDCKQASGGFHKLWLTTRPAFLQLPAFEVPVILLEIIIQQTGNDNVWRVHGDCTRGALELNRSGQPPRWKTFTETGSPENAVPQFSSGSKVGVYVGRLNSMHIGLHTSQLFEPTSNGPIQKTAGLLHFALSAMLWNCISATSKLGFGHLTTAVKTSISFCGGKFNAPGCCLLKLAALLLKGKSGVQRVKSIGKDWFRPR